MKEFVTIGYEYGELSDAAKEVVKQWYLNDDFRNETLESDLNYDLGMLFPHSNLKVEYSLGSCQGDGLNIYGNLKVEDLFANVAKAPIISDFISKFSENEIEILKSYTSITFDEIEIPRNHFGYAYCVADKIDFKDDWYDDLSYDNVNVDYGLIKKFEDEVINLFAALCRQYEKAGYEYLYECDDEEVEECCNANDWYFTAEGEFIT